MTLEERHALRDQLQQANRDLNEAIDTFTNNLTPENANRVKEIAQKQQQLNEKYWEEIIPK
ncbi:TPA: hypothetical protein GJ770_03935 [Legionella pneumophila]|nr:hypothetical protein [Legionella pneumophila]